MLKSVYPSLKLYIFGEGEDKEELTKYVREHNLQHIVFFKGYTKDVYNTMLGFNMHVLTSRYEGMGYVNLEAMALGIPVVTSDVGGATNFLRNGENALITAVGDHLSTAEAVKKLIEDENLRNRIIETAKEDVKYYNVARMAAETEKLYLENLCRF
jgi:glycosyltransferase involved in cell wall biosynthesis